MGTEAAFDTPIERRGGWLSGPPRRPRQMLDGQDFHGRATIHDDGVAQSMGFAGGTIEGPTHLSQFAPLGFAAWGRDWFERGCLSMHYRTACTDGDEARAFMAEPAGDISAIRLERADGGEVLTGTALIGEAESDLDRRLAAAGPPENPLILRDVKVGMIRPRVAVRMGMDDVMGPLYPFTLRQKLALITEPSPWYESADNPWGRPIIPFEMVSVLANQLFDSDPFPVLGPTVDLIVDHEVRMLAGPLFVGEDYEVERAVVGISGSRRTESLWVRSSIFRPGEDRPIAVNLQNTASLIESLPGHLVQAMA
ncbi:hypothetical protein ACFB49_48100 [Sphingomonas sp. DBB INV C78]|uniref:hypothetical protein n=1 Tax=Sphingomonas sp. DBB INV C78 TaxID=3349434 RepID=UPI0036D32DAE